MPPGRTLQEKGSRHQRHGPYTHIQPVPKKVKPQHERQRFKVQALSQLDAIANEGLQAVEAELTTNGLGPPSADLAPTGPTT